MRFALVAPFFCHASPPLHPQLCYYPETIPKADPKANEYPEPNCLDQNGGNNPTWKHKVLCGCVSIDLTIESVFLATSPSQQVWGFSNEACNPGVAKSESLGQSGGGCHNVGTEVTANPMQSALLWVPFICDVAELMGDLGEVAVDAPKEILGEI